MKYFLIAALLFFGLNAFSQTQDSLSQKSALEALWINPVHLLKRQASIYLDVDNGSFIKGYLFGYIFPNENLSESLRSMHSISQLKFSNYGVLAGIKYNLIEAPKVNFYTEARYTWRNDVDISRESHIDATTPMNGEVNIDQQEVSIRTHMEWFVITDTWRIKNKLFLGLGLNITYRYTFYNYYDDSRYGYKILRRRNLEKEDSWAEVRRDNGFFILPTVHVGYRIGYDLNK